MAESGPKVPELDAALQFKTHFESTHKNVNVNLQLSTLEEALKIISTPILPCRKVLLLYFHNDKEKFSKTFLESLNNAEAQRIMNEKYFLLGWDVQKSEYLNGLSEALNKVQELAILAEFLETKTCAAFFIVPVNDSITLLSMIAGNVREKDFLTTLRNAEDFLLNENMIEENLDQIDNSEQSIDSTKFQQLMCDRMGDRDYDSFDYTELDLLKDKIGYALYGPPKVETGYDDKSEKRITALFDVILDQTNRVSKWRDRVVISCIYNCTEPLPSTKLARAKKYDDYNPKTDLNPIPIFILRRCKNSNHPCRIIIDSGGRVYKNWNDYLTNNKLPQCQMVLPLTGKYEIDEDGKVKLEKHLSPACGVGSKIVKGTDVATTVAGIVSGGIVLTSAIAILPVAPFALAAAAITGLGVGLYSLARSAVTLHDRKVHKESLSFANSEARGAYLNLIAGSLGFVGAGTNVAISQLVSKGASIGQNATVAINIVNYASLASSGVGMVNSSYDIFDQLLNGHEKPSPLSFLQLSSSILFFGHAVYNFKTANMLIEEAQGRNLTQYHGALDKNSLQKNFNRLQKEAFKEGIDYPNAEHQAQVIKTLRNIKNKEEICGFLSHCEDLQHFKVKDDRILLNGVEVNLDHLVAIDRSEVVTFISTLEKPPQPLLKDISSIASKLDNVFGNCSYFGQIVIGLAQLLSHTDHAIKDKVMNVVTFITLEMMEKEPALAKTLDEIFPDQQKVFRMVNMVNSYFQKLVDEVEANYQKWLILKPSDDENGKLYQSLALDYTKRVLEIFNFVSEAYFTGTKPTEEGIKKLLDYCYTWVTKEYVTYEENKKRKEERKEHAKVPNVKVACEVCGGEYYQKPPKSIRSSK